MTNARGGYVLVAESRKKKACRFSSASQAAWKRAISDEPSAGVFPKERFNAGY